MKKKIRKAIIPAAGLGTRFLPATKSQPKEMLPIVDKPTLQYIIEEAIEFVIAQQQISGGGWEIVSSSLWYLLIFAATWLTMALAMIMTGNIIVGILGFGVFASYFPIVIYIIATIIMFHIVPLVFVMMGENGQLLLLQFFLMMLNPMFIALSGLIYGIKQGFNFKFPLFMAIISMVSIPMYYQFDAAANMMMTTIIMCIVYAIFSFAATVIGAFVKRLLRL